MTPLEHRRQMKELEEKQKQDLIDFKTKTRVKKSVIETFLKRNNAVAIKLLFYFSKVQEIEANAITLHSNAMATTKLKLDDVLTYCNIDRRTLKDNLEYLMQTSIEVYEETQNVQAFINILPKVVINDKNIEITMFQYIIAQVRNVVDNYVTIDTNNLMRLRHKHSLRMIQLLEMIDGYRAPAKKQAVYTLDDMNGIFGTKYQKTIDIERKILHKAKEELDSISTLSFEYEKKFENQGKGKSGRPKCVGFTIFVKENQNRQLKMF